MKNLASKLLVAALLLVGSAAFFSCNNDDDVKIKSYPMEVKFALNDGLAWNNITDAKLIVSNDKGCTIQSVLKAIQRLRLYKDNTTLL